MGEVTISGTVLSRFLDDRDEAEALRGVDSVKFYRDLTFEKQILFSGAVKLATYIARIVIARRFIADHPTEARHGWTLWKVLSAHIERLEGLNGVTLSALDKSVWYPSDFSASSVNSVVSQTHVGS